MIVLYWKNQKKFIGEIEGDQNIEKRYYHSSRNT